MKLGVKPNTLFTILHTHSKGVSYFKNEYHFSEIKTQVAFILSVVTFTFYIQEQGMVVLGFRDTNPLGV